MLSFRKLKRELQKAGITNMREYREESARRYALSSVEDWPYDPCSLYSISIVDLFRINKRCPTKFTKALKKCLKVGPSRQISTAAQNLEAEVVSRLEAIITPISSESPNPLPAKEFDKMLNEIEEDLKNRGLWVGPGLKRYSNSEADG